MICILTALSLSHFALGRVPLPAHNGTAGSHHATPTSDLDTVLSVVSVSSLISRYGTCEEDAAAHYWSHSSSLSEQRSERFPVIMVLNHVGAMPS
jgi:hypothetical protein